VPLVSGAPLSDEHLEWLESVAPLISEEEQEYFLAIRQAYRRDAFIERFWEVRDPDKLTRFNELHVRWKYYVEQAAVDFGYHDDRAVAFILNGEPGRWALPDGREVSRCFSRSQQLEIWFYGASERSLRRFPIIFLQRGAETRYEAWIPGSSLRARPRLGGLPSTDIGTLCGDELMPYTMAIINQMGDYPDLLEEVMTPPVPPEEWLATFAATTTDIPAGAERFEARLELAYPGRNQNRTSVQAVVGVELEDAGVREFEARRLHQFQIVGEVVRDGTLFEAFRYRYEMGYDESVQTIPLVFSRYLRSGPVTLHVRVHDVFAGRYARISREIDVPSAEGMASVRPKPTSGIFKLLAEASEAAARGERMLRLVPPQAGAIHVGYQRFDVRTVGEIEAVEFFLDDRSIMRKRRPPYSVELNLGSLPSTHLLRAVGYYDGSEVAMDELRVNQGGQRFRVHITEPRSDRLYESSITAMVQVDTPDARPIERLELFLNEERVATLYQPPFVQGLLLPDEALSYVRAVAYLPDGSSTEDVQFINAPDYLEEVEVQYVELHTLVVDGAERPILDLPPESFTVFEDGDRQDVRRFEYQRDLPIHAGLLVDTSASMEDSLVTVADAALSFIEESIEPQDRISVFSFAAQPRIEARFTNDTGEVKRALAGLEARGSTALYDSLVFALTYFDGVRGQKALLLLSDGKDEASAFTFDQALEVARRSGVIVYAVGLKDLFKEKAARKVLERIAGETGGRAFFVEELDELPGIYASVQDELRSRYLLTYQSTSDRDPSEFRVVRVEVEARGAEARTMRGYYP
jgi:VWFA-related protein